MIPAKSKLKQTLKWILAGLPLGVVIGSSFLPLQTWMQQTLILVVLLWMQAFFMFYAFSAGN